MPGEVADGTDFVVTAHEGPDREPAKILYNFEAKANYLMVGKMTFSLCLYLRHIRIIP